MDFSLPITYSWKRILCMLDVENWRHWKFYVNDLCWSQRRKLTLDQTEGGGKRNGWRGSKCTNLQLQLGHGDITYNTVMTANNTVLHIWKLQRIDLQSPHHKKKKSVCDYVWQILIGLTVVIIQDIYTYQIFMLYIWHKYDVICQLYLIQKRKSN